MGIFEVFMIGLGLSMDAAAVSMTNAMVYTAGRGKLKLMPLFFGGFQLLMTLSGYYAGNLFESVVNKYAGIIAFVILSIIGINMIREAFSEKEEQIEKELSLKILFAQGIATAIDAFVMGVSFGFMGDKLETGIILAVLVIGITTFFCTVAATMFGKKFGELLESKAEILGGVILILIGIKSLF